jgi:hypothetical protein
MTIAFDAKHKLGALPQAGLENAPSALTVLYK